MKPTKTWFPMGRGQYERTLTDQMRGLRPVVDEFRAAKARGRPLTCLDVGCAEGLIGIEMAKAGAAHVHGIELVPERVQDALRLRHSLPCSFEVADVATYTPSKAFDVVLALSILHKMPDPSETLRRLVATTCDKLVVIRLPPATGNRKPWVVVDPRSNNKPHDLNLVMESLRFVLTEETDGHLGEWIGYWRALV